MNEALRFHVVAWAGWLPGCDGLVMGGTASARGGLPLALRRRITPIGRKLMEAAWAILPEAEMQPRIVLSSRHGEYARTLGLLSSLAECGEVSPAEFSLSVHHALAGLLSIAIGNRAGHTAIASGADSFGYGLLEAVACAAEDDAPVLLLHFDEPLPDIYADVCSDADLPVVFACLLRHGPNASGRCVAMDFAQTERPSSDPLALLFADFLRSGRDVHGTGQRITWGWRHVA